MRIEWNHLLHLTYKLTVNLSLILYEGRNERTDTENLLTQFYHVFLSLGASLFATKKRSPLSPSRDPRGSSIFAISCPYKCREDVSVLEDTLGRTPLLLSGAQECPLNRTPLCAAPWRTCACRITCCTYRHDSHATA